MANNLLTDITNVLPLLNSYMHAVPSALHNNYKVVCSMKVENCHSFQRLFTVLHSQKILNNKEDVVALLDDYHHLLFQHADKFEDIFNVLNNQIYNNKGCSLSDCISFTRHRHSMRTTDVKPNENILATTYGDSDSVQQQILDTVHCFYMHSFDTGRRWTREEKAMFRVETDNEAENLTIMMNTTGEKIGSIQLEMNLNSKFTTDQYSYGYRYYYWKFYKNNDNRADFAKPIPVRNYSELDLKQTVGNWYIESKYKDFKYEILNNEMCGLSLSDWNNVSQKAVIYLESKYAKQMKCFRTETAECYDMKTDEPMQLRHTTSLIIYTSFDKLPRCFSETFRKLNDKESNDTLKERHRNYYFLGKALRECVECFGMTCPAKDFKLYHGVNHTVTFSSMYPYIKGPFSTTQNKAVALNFSAFTGMLLELNISVNEWRMRPSINRMNCMDCMWISDFTVEEEILFVGGVNRHTFQNILDLKTNVSYEIYMKALKQMTYCMSNCNMPLDTLMNANVPKTKEEETMVFRLMAHELYTHPQYKSSEPAHEFKGCPEYFKQTMHQHCISIKSIAFYDKLSYVFETFFQTKNGWVIFDRLLTVFPNIENFGFHIDDVQIVEQGLQDLYQHLLLFININKTISLRKIIIHLHGEHKDKLQQIAHEYIDKYNESSWSLRLRDVTISLLQEELMIDLNHVDRILGEHFGMNTGLMDDCDVINSNLGIQLEITKGVMLNSHEKKTKKLSKPKTKHDKYMDETQDGDRPMKLFKENDIDGDNIMNKCVNRQKFAKLSLKIIENRQTNLLQWKQRSIAIDKFKKKFGDGIFETSGAGKKWWETLEIYSLTPTFKIEKQSDTFQKLWSKFSTAINDKPIKKQYYQFKTLKLQKHVSKSAVVHWARKNVYWSNHPEKYRIIIGSPEKWIEIAHSDGYPSMKTKWNECVKVYTGTAITFCNKK